MGSSKMSTPASRVSHHSDSLVIDRLLPYQVSLWRLAVVKAFKQALMYSARMKSGVLDSFSRLCLLIKLDKSRSNSLKPEEHNPRLGIFPSLNSFTFIASRLGVVMDKQSHTACSMDNQPSHGIMVLHIRHNRLALLRHKQPHFPSSISLLMCHASKLHRRA